MFSNVSIDNERYGYTTLEVLKNGNERVAVAAFFDRTSLRNLGQNVDSNGTVYYRATLDADATFEFRIKLDNKGQDDDVILVKNIQNSVRIWENPRPVTDNPINAGCTW